MTQITIQKLQEEFKKNVREEYESDRVLSEDIGNLLFVKKTDGTFTKIGIKQKLDPKIFDPNENYFRGMFGLGHSIAVGEMNHYVKEIVRQIKQEDTYEIDITDLRELKDRLSQLKDFFGDLVLLTSPNIHYFLLTKRMTTYNYEGPEAKEYFNGSNIRVNICSSELIGDSIIFYEKSKVDFIYKIGNDSPLFLDFIQNEDNYYTSVYSILKVVVKPHKIIKFKINNAVR